MEPTRAYSASDRTKLEAVGWKRALEPYRRANRARAVRELAVTAFGLLALVGAMLWAVSNQRFGVYAALLLPAAGFLVRLFMIQHDCAHRSFFPTRRANDLAGRLIGIATLTPHDHWRMSHSFHHASTGNLDRRGIGDVYTLTVAEYRARTRWARFRYWLYRHPAVMFGVGPAYLFLLHNRLPMGHLKTGWSSWLSTMGTNVGMGVVLALLLAAVGPGPLLSVYVPVVLIAAAAGVWLFYVQHQFATTHWARGEGWSAERAALHGSSHYDLPPVLRWFTANIGMHTVHHLSSRIPFYRLPEVLRDHRELLEIGRVGLVQSFDSVRLTLWDEGRCRLISFEQARLDAQAVVSRTAASPKPLAGSAGLGSEQRPL